MRDHNNVPVCDEKAANRYVSRVIPWVLLGIVIYASYAVTKQLCIDYLIHPLPSYERSSRVGAGAAILVVFYVLLLPAGITYLRLYFTVLFNPDFVPRGRDWTPDPNNGRRKRSRTRGRGIRGASNSDSREKNGTNLSADVEGGTNQMGGNAFPLDDTGTEAFYTKDLFVCQDDGRPAYCSRCCQVKTDRVHHNSDADRCVRKLDHFCPWVGGVVSESSHKFFLQFVFYTALFCGFNLAVLANFLAELRRDTGRVNVHWAVALGLSGLFFLFSAGMTGTSLHLAVTNTSTIESLSRHSKVWTLAVHISRPQDSSHWAQTFATVTYPVSRKPTSANSSDLESAPEKSRVFAILRTQPGENPFDLGSPLKNLQQVFGYTLWDWLLPLKPSPCTDHRSSASAYPMGPVVERLKREAGLIDDSSRSARNRKSSRHRRRRHSHQRPRSSDRPEVSAPSQQDESAEVELSDRFHTVDQDRS